MVQHDDCKVELGPVIAVALVAMVIVGCLAMEFRHS